VSKNVAICLFLLFAAVSAAVAEPQDTEFPGYTKRIWEARDGLPNQTAQVFAQTKDGSLWIGTTGGLLRFDGARFTAYNRQNAPLLLERSVNCLLASRDGSLWIGTEGGGLVRLQKGVFQRISAPGGLSNSFIRAVYEDHRGIVWVGADQGLFRVSGASMTRVDGSRGTPSIFVRAIAEDQHGHIWVGGTTLLEFDGASVREHAPNRKLTGDLITSMLIARDGNFWVGTLSGLFKYTSSGVWSRIQGFSAQVAVIQEDTNGLLWVGTVGQGLYLYRQRHLVHVSSTGLPSRTVQAVLEDGEKNIWLGTRAGILSLSRTPVNIISLPGGADFEFETIYRDSDGSIWVAASTQLFRIRDGLAKPFSFAGLSNLRVRTLLRDRQGNLWIGTEGSGLLRMVGNKIQRLTNNNGLINDFVRVIMQSRDGSIWVGTDGGVTHIGPRGLQNYAVQSGLAYFSITALFEDRNGDVWVGTSRGLSHISKGRIVRDAATNSMQNEQLWSIDQDTSGAIWFGTSSGLYGYRAGKVVHLTTSDGLANNTIYQILQDSKENFWLSGPNSVSRLAVTELDAFATGEKSRVHLNLYLNSYEMESAVLYSGMQPGGLVTRPGDLWFPSNKGAVHIAADQIIPRSSSPVVIDQLVADGQQIPPGQTVGLRPGNGRLEISYAAIHLRSQEGLRYRYKMEGLESWSEASTRRTADYTHLPSGKYRFRVQSFEVDNPDAVSESSILIVQEPHFYSTLWFVGCCAIALFGLVFMIYTLHIRQMRMRFLAVSEERTRLAREMHDTVIQGCVGVSSLLEAALGVEDSEEPLRQQLLSYATDQIRATIEAAREAVWALRNSSVSAADARSLCEDLARKFQSDTGIPIRCNVSGVPFKLGESATHELMLTIKEALTNAVTHANPKSVNIDVCFTKHDLQIEVRDDGWGFDPSAILPRNGHYGILGMQERARLLGGDLKIKSDLVQGTTLCIFIPRKWRMMERIVTGNASQDTRED
jgi:ligand-binding sensor domain-containing protein/signal transduction histidine kinase